jgi:hypothetical protein
LTLRNYFILVNFHFLVCATEIVTPKVHGTEAINNISAIIPKRWIVHLRCLIFWVALLDFFLIAIVRTAQCFALQEWESEEQLGKREEWVSINEALRLGRITVLKIKAIGHIEAKRGFK